MAEKKELLFKRKNFMILLAGIGLLVLGYFLLSLKNATTDTESIFYKYSFIKMYVSPILLLGGFITIVVSIFKK